MVMETLEDKRMSTKSFDELHMKLKDCLQRQNTFMRECIQPIEMLAVTLRYLASGCTFSDLHYTYLLGILTISKIIREVCCAIWAVLQSECIPVPNKKKWESIALKFETVANFPHCLGAVDEKHIRIVHPLNSMYINYKGYSSIVLMAVADAEYRFIYANVGAYGKDCDSNVFQNCRLWSSIINGTMDLPEDKCLPGTQNPIPYYFIGDDAFGLHKHLLKPYEGHSLTLEKRIYNYRVCRARRYVECTFGILSNKWRIFHRAISLDPSYATDIVKACVVLQNFVRNREMVLKQKICYPFRALKISTWKARE
ncbi:protein ALP1-like isoform X1 [Nilaparvata lugens]|uniref:protein ALP1-like isoform X1 n=1 Tax=Nilaparvata lugens TaxID=108931 RepID=UPI00193CA49B|nr:protein ALP1-like isoform X1 [Nilaparvata lugens]